MPNRLKLICALDTGDLGEARECVEKLAPYVGAFKIGHSLTLQNGLRVVDHLREAGANRIFLDLKFHDIPNTVALAVREASKAGVWMLTLHIAGGPAMISAASEEAKMHAQTEAPLLIGVSVLTSLDQHVLSDHLGVNRSVDDHMTYMSKLGVDCGLDGVVCSVQEVAMLRRKLDRAIIVTPGIRGEGMDPNDQRRVGTAARALEDGSDYLVIGRALSSCTDPERALEELGIIPSTL